MELVAGDLNPTNFEVMLQLALFSFGILDIPRLSRIGGVFGQNDTVGVGGAPCVSRARVARSS
jgi:hypothetical protein